MSKDVPEAQTFDLETTGLAKTKEQLVQKLKEVKTGEKDQRSPLPSDPAKKQSQADKLVMLCERKTLALFCDQTGAAYARIEDQGTHKTVPIHAQAFKAWLANLLWMYEEKAPGTQAVYSALNVLTAKAYSNPERIPLYNRVASGQNCIWIDMCDDRWRAIKVTTQGWTIIEEPPILFKRYNHQLPLQEPVRGGDPWKLFDFLNIDPEDTATRLVLLCKEISSLVPNIPHPIDMAYGHQGSGKSWLLRILRRLIDPSAIEIQTLPNDIRELVQQLDHNYCAFYDNITSLPTWASDALCRAATGSGFSKRELYSDDDDIIYPNIKRIVALNGINITAQRGDLLDRSNLIGLQDIPRERRRTEQELESKFESLRAEILGGFLDTLVKAMQLYPSVNPKGLFRMADFTRWGCAIAVALGRTQEEFIKAYEEKVNSQVEEAAHASPVATVLIDLLEARKKLSKIEPWNDTPTKLYTELLNHAKTLGISTHQRSWPKAPHVLVRQLNELAPSLKALGWELSTIKSGSTKRITVSSVPSDSTVPPHTPPKIDRNARDGTPPTSFCLTQENMNAVLNALIRSSNVRGSAHLTEIIQESGLPETDVEAILKQLEREGKAYAPYQDYWKVV